MRWWKDLAERHVRVEQRIEQSTRAMRDVADVVLQLRASTDRLENVLADMQKDVAALREETNGDDGTRSDVG